MSSKTIGLPNLIFGLLMIIIAIVSVFVPVASGIITTAVPLIASVASFFGFKKWREKYLEVKKYYQSKTVWGAILTTLPIIAVALITFFGWVIPDWATQILYVLVVAGGALNSIGIFDALKKAGVLSNG
jgi:hypothetical protein